MKINPALKDFIVPMKSIKENPDNARSHEDEADIEAKVASLKQFGQQVPIIVAKNKVIVAGNGIYLAAQRLKATQIAAWPFDGTPEEAKAYGIMDNRTSEMSTWNIDALAVVVQKMAGQERKMLVNVGFSPEELQQYIEASSAKAPVHRDLKDRSRDSNPAAQDKNPEAVSLVLHFTETEHAEMAKLMALLEKEEGVELMGDQVEFFLTFLAEAEGVQFAKAQRKKAHRKGK